MSLLPQRPSFRLSGRSTSPEMAAILNGSRDTLASSSSIVSVEGLRQVLGANLRDLEADRQGHHGIDEFTACEVFDVTTATALTVREKSEVGKTPATFVHPLQEVTS